MKRILTAALILVVACSFVFGASKVSIKPKYKAKKEFETKVNWTMAFEDNLLSYQWNYILRPSKVKSGYITKTRLKNKELGLYRGNKQKDNGYLKYDTSLLGETPETSKEFEVKYGMLNNYLKTLPTVEKGKADPKLFFRLLIAITYVYQHNKSFELGTEVSAPKAVISELKDLLGLKISNDLEYKIKGIKKISKKEPVFGCEKGVLFSTSLSWRKDDTGIELRGLAVLDDKKDLIMGYKAHGWFRSENMPFRPLNNSYSFTLMLTNDPPGGFEDSKSPALEKLPKMPENVKPDEDDTPSADPKKVGKIEKGKEAPAWTLKNLDGDDVSLSDFKGKVVLMHVWASTIPGIETYLTKTIKPNYDKLKSADLEIISVGIPYKGDTIDKEKAIVTKNNLDWTFVWDETKQTVNVYQLTSPGFWVLIGKDGKVGEFGSISDPDDLKKIDKFLGDNLTKK